MWRQGLFDTVEPRECAGVEPCHRSECKVIDIINNRNISSTAPHGTFVSCLKRAMPWGSQD